MHKLSRILTTFAVAAGLISGGCDIFINNNSTTKTGSIDTVTIIGTPVLDSLNVSLSIVPLDAGGTAIMLDAGDVVFHIDSVSSHYTGYTLTTYQITNSASTGTKPLAAQLIFDGSGSMSSSDYYNQRQPAAKTFINILAADNAKNKVAIAEFGSSYYNYYFHLWRNFTVATNTTALFPCLDSLTEDGSTPLYTSIRRGLEHTDSAVSASSYARAIIAFTDGGDNDSYYYDNTLGYTVYDSLTTVIRMAKTKKIPVSVIGLGNTVEYAYMQQLASATGGVFAPVDSANALSSVFSALATGISTGYTTVIAQFNTLPPIGTKFYVTVFITSGGTTIKKHFVLTVSSSSQKRKASTMDHR